MEYFDSKTSVLILATGFCLRGNLFDFEYCPGLKPFALNQKRFSYLVHEKLVLIAPSTIESVLSTTIPIHINKATRGSRIIWVRGTNNIVILISRCTVSRISDKQALITVTRIQRKNRYCAIGIEEAVDAAVSQSSGVAGRKR